MSHAMSDSEDDVISVTSAPPSPVNVSDDEDGSPEARSSEVIDLENSVTDASFVTLYMFGIPVQFLFFLSAVLPAVKDCAAFCSCARHCRSSSHWMLCRSSVGCNQ